MDINKAIRMAIDTGDIAFGSKAALHFSRAAGAKLILVAANCPLRTRKSIEHYASLSGVRVAKFPGTSLELGSVCGRPYPISALTVIEAGDSEILKAE